MRNYKKEVEDMLPGDSELDKLLRKETLLFLELFREGSPMMMEYDKDVQYWYNERYSILSMIKELQHDYILLQQRMNIFKHQLAQLRDKMTKIHNEPPLWDSIMLNNMKGNKSNE